MSSNTIHVGRNSHPLGGNVFLAIGVFFMMLFAGAAGMLLERRGIEGQSLQQLLVLKGLFSLLPACAFFTGWSEGVRLVAKTCSTVRLFNFEAITNSRVWFMATFFACVGAALGLALSAGVANVDLRNAAHDEMVLDTTGAAVIAICMALVIGFRLVEAGRGRSLHPA